MMTSEKTAKSFEKDKQDKGQKESRIDLESGSWESIRREYDKKYPVFGSQIHFAFDVIRRAIKDARGS